MKRLFVLVVLAGCDGPNIVWEGEDLHHVVPFDDLLRDWEYGTPDTSVGYFLRLRERKETEVVGRHRVSTLVFQADCFNREAPCDVDADQDIIPDFEKEVLGTWRMSSDAIGGVLFHGVDDVTFDPPVLLADSPMKVGTSVETVSNGITFTATYVGKETCPAERYWPNPDTRPDCVRIELDDGGAGSGIAGVYWAVRTVGITGFQLEHDGVLWGLRKFASCERNKSSCGAE